MDLLRMSREELLALKPEDIQRALMAEEVVAIARTLGAFWTYDYGAAERGKLGLHAELKSGRHSDGFFVSRIMLESPSIRMIIAGQIVRKIRSVLSGGLSMPTCVVGVPDGATSLGEDIGQILGLRVLEMQKDQGRIHLISNLEAGESLLLIEDFCTRGTGFTEAVLAVREAQSAASFFPYDPVIINRGGLSNVCVAGVGDFTILPVVERRIQDWDPTTEGCPLCAKGSQVIKPKTTDENWARITTSQK